MQLLVSIGRQTWTIIYWGRGTRAGCHERKKAGNDLLFKWMIEKEEGCKEDAGKLRKGIVRQKWLILTKGQACRREEGRSASVFREKFHLYQHDPEIGPCGTQNVHKLDPSLALGCPGAPDGKRAVVPALLPSPPVPGPGHDRWECSRDGRCWQSSTWGDFITECCLSPAAQQSWLINRQKDNQVIYICVRLQREKHLMKENTIN